MNGDRDAVFDYIFSRADAVGYMGLDSASSSKFQDDLENDPALAKMAGEKLSRKYIKDTVLNNYSKKRRYIDFVDVTSIINGICEDNVIGTRKDLENGVWSIKYLDNEFRCTSVSFTEWHTAIRRFGKHDPKEIKFAFLTCGGIKKEKGEIRDVKDILKSYGIIGVVVKPNEQSIDITQYIVKKNLSETTKITKGFILLAGISGTGKTRFIREQAKMAGTLSENYSLTSVRPDWHEPSDLLGYISRLNGIAEYIITDVVQFIVKAWRNLVDTGFVVTSKYIDTQGYKLVVEGDQAQLERALPYWLCLDEMNLAPVEQYFSDYLSVLETREWCWDGNNFIYFSDALLKIGIINQVDDKNQLRKEFGLTEAPYDELWSMFCLHGISIPFNLIVAGTVNMDETTHGFSRKVIDRAISFDFGEFFPNNFNEYFKSSNCNKMFSYPIFSQVDLKQLPAVDSDGQKSIDFLRKVNEVLDNTPFKLAFRALNELLLAVVSIQPQNELELKAVWDDFLMYKVLPRIEGDSDKLVPDVIENSLLNQLTKLLEKEFVEFWNEPQDLANARPDLYREKIGKEGDEKVLRIACRSKKKLDWMQKRLTNSGFTSFWP